MFVPILMISASLLLAIGFYFGLLGNSWIRFVAVWTAQWTSIGLGFVGISTTVNGTILASENFAVNVVAECTAIGPLLLYAGAVAAYPARLKSKGAGIILGLVVLTLVNVVRIVSLFWLGLTFPQYLDVAHLIVWQSGIILLAIILWLFWAEKMTSAGNR